MTREVLARRDSHTGAHLIDHCFGSPAKMSSTIFDFLMMGQLTSL